MIVHGLRADDDTSWFHCKSEHFGFEICSDLDGNHYHSLSLIEKKCLLKVRYIRLACHSFPQNIFVQYCFIEVNNYINIGLSTLFDSVDLHEGAEFNLRETIFARSRLHFSSFSFFFLVGGGRGGGVAPNHLILIRF